MKSRRDLIIKAGFGELSPGDQAKLDSLSPEEFEQVEQVKKVREGLKALREVPECQMSSERLRDAILNQGVVPSRQSKPWTFAIVAAAAILVVFFGSQLDVLVPGDTVSSLDSGDPESGLEGVLPPADGDIVNPDENGDTEPSESGAANGNSLVAVLDASVATNVGRFRPSNNSASRAGSRADDTEEWGVPPWQRGSEGGMSLVRFDPLPDSEVFPTFLAATGSQDDEYSDNLVVIDYVEDPDTGAFVATEVETFGDVVFGG
ncbi:MAG: hypothetical protein IH944_14055 [Armatimonadetes bacterium]|nr:hypothetical protein [Armatimonadota bacterium]